MAVYGQRRMMVRVPRSDFLFLNSLSAHGRDGLSPVSSRLGRLLCTDAERVRNPGGYTFICFGRR